MQLAKQAVPRDGQIALSATTRYSQRQGIIEFCRSMTWDNYAVGVHTSSVLFLLTVWPVYWPHAASYFTYGNE